MASSSTTNFSVTSVDRSSLQYENDLLASDRVASTHSSTRHSLALQSSSPCIETQKLVCDPQLASTVSRSRNSVGISSFMVAAATAFSLSVVPFDGVAVAAELEVNSSAVISDVNNSSTGAGQNWKIIKSLYPALDPSINSNPASGLSLSIAIPIPQEKEWIIVWNGHPAPLLKAQTQGMSSLKCPPWTPSDLEMFLPDLNGRPKPFPPKGHQWSASFTEEEGYIDAILKTADIGTDAQESRVNNFSSAEATLNERKEDNKAKVDRFTCFSL